MKYGDLINKIDRFYSLAKKESKVHGPYVRPDKRSIVIIIDEKGKRRTVSYPKYLMEQHLGRVLDPDTETVDHIDRNHENNDINNLRIMPRSDHSRADTRRVIPIELTCAMCKTPFHRSPRLLRDKSKKGKSGPFCSRVCAGRYARKLQLGLIDKLPVQPDTASEYYRNIKDIHASIEHLILKYS